MMLRGCVLVVALLASAWSLPAELPEPGRLALELGEEEFEDYLDQYLALQQMKQANNVSEYLRTHSGCNFRVNGDLGQPQPVYLRGARYLSAADNSGVIHLDAGEKIRVVCVGNNRHIAHAALLDMDSVVEDGKATCVNGNIVYGSGWMNDETPFGELVCSGHSVSTAEYTGERCYNNNQVIRVGHVVDGVFHPWYWSCFDQERLEVLYVWYEQNPDNAVHQTSVSRPGWNAGTFYPGVAINTQYTQVQQKIEIASYVGEELADKYVTARQYLARGHLSAKTDFVFATGQRSTFFFINAAPQWQPFNAGNWNWLEQNLRARIGVARYRTMVYTGTFGVSQLRDQAGRLVDIYLHRDANNNPQVPVPLYFYKVVYDESRQLGTAFVSINNPYYTEEEVKALTFCTDRCRNNPDFAWIGWQVDRIDLGYSFCCDVDDFRRTIPHLPAFTVNGLLV
ncbi:hypothetical protein JYU34_009647 [Plutella xylostella]|uniref:DNA/RNA non-specific endonuclease domain-containing protein n=1 Tax=Plutella xylostella TaxID=51655 RepID=A0ABQ7QK25_PLUXY|nr:hypothetical protein JYU34_009647 [Plutella xylostella]